MGLYTLRYKVKKRWIKTDEIDQWGDDVLLVNPDPTVVVQLGVWTQRKRMDERHIEHAKFETSASCFREMTGIMVYGGDVEPRGNQKAYVDASVHAGIQARWELSGGGNKRRTRNVVTKVRTRPDRLKDIQEGRIGILKGVKPIRRRRK